MTCWGPIWKQPTRAGLRPPRRCCAVIPIWLTSCRRFSQPSRGSPAWRFLVTLRTPLQSWGRRRGPGWTGGGQPACGGRLRNERGRGRLRVAHADQARGHGGRVQGLAERGPRRWVALKRIKSGRFASRVEVRRFLDKARAAANLEHPNIVKIYQVGESDGEPFSQHEAIRDGTLHDRCRGFRSNLGRPPSF